MQNGYVIYVGHYTPQKVVISVPNKDGNPSANVAEAFKTVGIYPVINRSRVWARRVLDNGKLAKSTDGTETTVEVTTLNYHGKLEFLKWGDAKLGAQAIDIRFLPQSQSLDVDYQDNIQKIKLDAEGKDGSAFVELAPGENKYDYKKDALFITYLQVHAQNKDSVSKNPNPTIKGFTFYEVTSEIADSEFIKQEEASLTAGNFVKGLSADPSKLKNLLQLFLEKGVDFGDVNLLSTDLDIYKTLLQFAKVKPGDFGFFVNEYKKELSECFQKADACKALDITKDGFVALIIKNKPQIIFEVEGKGDEMLVNVLNDFLNNTIFERTKHFKVQCDELLNGA